MKREGLCKVLARAASEPYRVSQHTMYIHSNKCYFLSDPGFSTGKILLRLPEVQNGDEVLATAVVNREDGRYTVHLHFDSPVSEDAHKRVDIGYLTVRGLELVRPHDHESCSIKHHAFAKECSEGGEIV